MPVTHSVETSASPAVTPDGLPMPRRLWAIATLMVSLAIASLDVTMANVALPAIAADLGVAPGLVVWVMIAYSVTILVTLLPLSALAERVGFRRMFVVGITLFMFWAVAVAFSSSFVMLLTARVIQAIGTSMLMCLFGGLVRNIYPSHQLGFGVSLNAMMVSVMAVLGPTIGAFIIEWSSWHWMFLMYVPLCLATYFGVRFLPDVPRTVRPFDWLACVLSALAFGLFVIGLDMLVSSALWAVILIVVSGLSAWLLYRHSREQEAPVVPLDLLRIKPVAFAVGASATLFAAHMAAFVALPFYLINIMQYSYAHVGVLMGGWAIGSAVMAPVAGYLSDRFQVAVLCIVGAGLSAVGMFWIVLLPSGTSLFWGWVPMLVGGLGFGFFQSPNNRALLSGAPHRRSGAAGGLQATTRVFGQSVGTALAALSFHFGGPVGATVALVVGVALALGAVGINVARYFSRAPDLSL
nr:MFS transporter [Pusillimonas sp. NJUB218]